MVVNIDFNFHGLNDVKRFLLSLDGESEKSRKIYNNSDCASVRSTESVPKLR